MEDDPYSTMVETMRQAGKGPAAGACLGQVLQAEPLKVLAEGNALDAGRLLVDPRLLRGYGERLEPDFLTGDQLLLLPIEERQRYVVVCRVVAV